VLGAIGLLIAMTAIAAAGKAWRLLSGADRRARRGRSRQQG
jgi:hypothetical protein